MRRETAKATQQFPNSTRKTVNSLRQDAHRRCALASRAYRRGKAEIAKSEIAKRGTAKTFPDGIVLERAPFDSIETPERVYKNSDSFFERSDFYRTLIQNISQPEHQDRKHLS